LGKLPLCPRCGHSLMMDKIAINEEAYYKKSSNSIGGLCCDHAGLIDIKLTDYKTITNALQAVHDESPVCHYGKEATVAAIAAFSPENYTPLPILVSPTCKSERADCGERLLQMILECWHTHPDKEAKFGPVWCFSTEGDSTCQVACHSLFMKYDLDPSSELYEKLSCLAGLNLKFGAHLITMDFDPKHLVK
ncbi:hypothetical protein PAXRUDRAFT_50620, partial [Paxillus rubicundulus Ve08.2h10]